VQVNTHLGWGLAAGFATALIGASWQVISRSAAVTPLGPVELAVLRYLIPAVLLSPVLLRIGLLPSGVPRRTLAVLVLGSGLPFGLLAFAGSRLAPAAHMGVLMAATGPLITAALLWGIERRRVARTQAVGLALIALGVALIAGQSLRAGAGLATLAGDALFLLAATVWSLYGIAFRGSGLTPWQGAALVSGWSALLVLPCVALFGAPGLAAIAAPALALQAAWQGVVAGVFGIVTYTAAVRHLGPAGAAGFGALVPVLAAVGGWLLLNEPVGIVTAVAAAVAALGVAIVSGALAALRATPESRR